MISFTKVKKKKIITKQNLEDLSSDFPTPTPKFLI